MTVYFPDLVNGFSRFRKRMAKSDAIFVLQKQSGPLAFFRPGG
jgi:hypothetical protein